MNAVKVKAKDLNLLRENTFIPREKIYAEESVIVKVPGGDYTVATRTITGYGTPFQVSEVTFSVQGEEKPFTVQVRPGVTLDEDEDIRISLYVATRDEDFGNGKKPVKRGNKKVFALQA